MTSESNSRLAMMPMDLNSNRNFTLTYTIFMRSILALLLIILSTNVFADQLPHGMTPVERAAMPDYLRQIRTSTINGIITPPVSPVRASAEWEEIDALMVVWTSYTNTIREIIRYARTETRVIVICTDSNQVITNLTANQVPLGNVDFIQTAFNSVWARDFGQWNVYTNDVDSLLLIDWIYNRPRAKDDSVPRAIATFTGLPLYETTTSPYDLIHTGGNFMCDGLGTGFSSRLVIDENPTKTEPQIDSIMQSFMGIDRYIKMNTLPYDQIHHIDMHMKLLDEETLLVGEYPPGVADGPAIEANLNYILTNFNSPFGTPYKVIRIPMPPDAMGAYPNTGGDYRTYANAVFVNKTVIVPTYDPQYDTTALRIWQEALPGYRIVGIDCNTIIPALGAIHCITKEVSSNDPLLIVHQPLRDQSSLATGYTVTGTFQHRSGISQAILYYRTDTLQPYTSVSMSSTGNPEEWTADIPAQPVGSTVYYYLHGESVSGKMQNRPLSAPAGYWSFKVDGSLGISPLASLTTGEVYPNPSHGWTCLNIHSPKSQNLQARLTNTLGQTVVEIFDGAVQAGEKRIWFDTSMLSTGVYLLEVSDGTQVLAHRKVVVR